MHFGIGDYDFPGSKIMVGRWDDKHHKAVWSDASKELTALIDEHLQNESAGANDDALTAKIMGSDNGTVRAQCYRSTMTGGLYILATTQKQAMVLDVPEHVNRIIQTSAYNGGSTYVMKHGIWLVEDWRVGKL
jgi:hypothetical protein